MPTFTNRSSIVSINYDNTPSGDFPSIFPGDFVEVYYFSVGKQLCFFRGVVIRHKGSRNSRTFTLVDIPHNIFFSFSPRAATFGWATILRTTGSRFKKLSNHTRNHLKRWGLLETLIFFLLPVSLLPAPIEGGTPIRLSICRVFVVDSMFLIIIFLFIWLEELYGFLDLSLFLPPPLLVFFIWEEILFLSP